MRNVNWILALLLLLAVSSWTASATTPLSAQTELDEIVTVAIPAAPAAPVFGAAAPRRRGRPLLPASARGVPLVTLVMIVKNEAKSLPATLESVLGWVDRLSILDTGSVDGGDRLIEDWCARNLDRDQWELHRGPFVDFSTTRNEALRLAGNVSEFILVLNGDDRLVNGRHMRRFLEARRHLHARRDEAMYIVPVHYGTVSRGRSERLMRSRNHFVANWPTDPFNHWRYEGVTHEVYVCQAALQGGWEMEYTPDRDEDGQVGFHVLHDITYDTKASKMDRFRLDVELLLGEISGPGGGESLPNRPRSMYYLAQSYYNLGEFTKAFEWYRRRVDTNYTPRPTPPTVDNEKSRSYALMASMVGGLGGTKTEMKKYLMQAHAHCPTAYSLFQLANFFVDVEPNRAQARSYARQSKEYMQQRKASMLCSDDQQLVAQHMPKLIAKINKMPTAGK